MISVDFTYYKDEYGGTLITDQDKFDEYVKKSQNFLVEISLGNYLNLVLEDDSNVKDCLCVLAEYEQTDADRIQKNSVSSESVGGHSRSYNSSATSKTPDEIKSEKKAIAYAYIASTGIFYRGI